METDFHKSVNYMWMMVDNGTDFHKSVGYVRNSALMYLIRVT